MATQPTGGRDTRARIVVLDGHTLDPGDNPWDPVSRLGKLTVFERTPAPLIVERAREAGILLTNKTPLRASSLAQLPALRFVAVLATGYDVVDIAAARARGILVANVPEYGTESVAQHTFALLLELCNHVAAHAAAVTTGRWARSEDFCFWTTPPLELAGKTIGIVGLGRIGRRVAEIASAFRMCVSSASARSTDRADLERLFATADVVSLHCPLSAETAGLVGHDLLGRMKPTAFLLNTARGGLVDEAALRDALKSGQLAGAGFDVSASEPIASTSPLLDAPNLIVTPHMAWASLAARRRLMETTARNVEAFLAGTPINVVN